VTSSVDVIEAAIWVKSMYDKIVMKKRENMEIEKKLYLNLHLNEDFGMEFTGC